MMIACLHGAIPFSVFFLTGVEDIGNKPYSTGNTAIGKYKSRRVKWLKGHE